MASIDFNSPEVSEAHTIINPLGVQHLRLVAYTSSESSSESEGESAVQVIPPVPESDIGRFNLLEDFDLSYQRPDSFHEPSLITDIPQNISTDGGPMEIKWELIIPGGTKRGGDQLGNNLGYTFHLSRKSNNGDYVYWVCARRVADKCKARVTQRGSVFEQGQNVHVLSASSWCAVLVSKVRSVTKTVAAEHPYLSAMAITAQTIRDIISPGAACKIPPPVYIARNAIRKRQKDRPQHPVDLKFLLNTSAIPNDFLKHDAQVDDNRHLLFATNYQLQLLQRAENWFVDGTFKVN